MTLVTKKINLIKFLLFVIFTISLYVSSHEISNLAMQPPSPTPLNSLCFPVVHIPFLIILEASGEPSYMKWLYTVWNKFNYI